MLPLFGVDESIYQPIYDNHYKTLKDNGGSFSIIRSSQGASFVDSSLDEHFAGNKAAGLALGLYHWIDPTYTGRVNADYFSRIIDQYKDTVFILGDWEQWWEWETWSQCYEKHLITADKIIRLDPHKIYDCSASFFDILKTRYAGRELGVYSAYWYLFGYQNGLDTWAVAKDLRRVIASYINLGKGDITEGWDAFKLRLAGLANKTPLIPPGWDGSWDMWQISSNILVPKMPRIDWDIINPTSTLNKTLGGTNPAPVDPPVTPPPPAETKKYCVYIPTVVCPVLNPVTPPTNSVLFRCYVNVSWLTVLSQPSAQATPVKWIPLNSPMDILEVRGAWGRYIEGWVNLSYTRR